MRIELPSGSDTSSALLVREKENLTSIADGATPAGAFTVSFDSTKCEIGWSAIVARRAVPASTGTTVVPYAVAFSKPPAVSNSTTWIVASIA